MADVVLGAALCPDEDHVRLHHEVFSGLPVVVGGVLEVVQDDVMLASNDEPVSVHPSLVHGLAHSATVVVHCPAVDLGRPIRIRSAGRWGRMGTCDVPISNFSHLVN